MLVLRIWMVAAITLLRVLPEQRRGFHRGGTGCETAAAARRTVWPVQRLHQGDRRRGAYAVSAVGDHRSRDDESRSGSDESGISETGALRSRQHRNQSVYVLS